MYSVEWLPPRPTVHSLYKSVIVHTSLILYVTPVWTEDVRVIEEAGTDEAETDEAGTDEVGTEGAEREETGAEETGTEGEARERTVVDGIFEPVGQSMLICNEALPVAIPLI